MTRTILVGLSAAALSWVLVCLSVVAWLSWTPSGHFVRGPEAMSHDSPAVHKQYGDPFELLGRAKTGYQLLVIPVISIVTGLFAGYVGKARAGWIAVVALFPLQAFLLAADGLRMSAFVRALAYFILAYFAASIVHSMRARRPRNVAATTT